MIVARFLSIFFSPWLDEDCQTVVKGTSPISNFLTGRKQRDHMGSSHSLLQGHGDSQMNRVDVQSHIFLSRSSAFIYWWAGAFSVILRVSQSFLVSLATYFWFGIWKGSQVHGEVLMFWYIVFLWYIFTKLLPFFLPTLELQRAIVPTFVSLQTFLQGSTICIIVHMKL